MDDADILIGQHHRIFLGIREGGVNLCMTIVVVSCQIEGFLVQGSRHGTVYLIGHGQFDGFLDVLESGITTLWLYLTKLKRREVDALQVNDVDSAVFELSLLDTIDSIDFQVEAKQLNGLLHNGGIARDHRAALLVSLFSVQGAHRNLRTNACGVAHGDG